eukprot:365203-Chlamydomonas_euryale.AAC.3
MFKKQCVKSHATLTAQSHNRDSNLIAHPPSHRQPIPAPHLPHSIVAAPQQQNSNERQQRRDASPPTVPAAEATIAITLHHCAKQRYTVAAGGTVAGATLAGATPSKRNHAEHDGRHQR